MIRKGGTTVLGMWRYMISVSRSSEERDFTVLSGRRALAGGPNSLTSPGTAAPSKGCSSTAYAGLHLGASHWLLPQPQMQFPQVSSSRLCCVIQLLTC